MEVAVPVPEDARVGVVAARHLVVTDDVRPVPGYAVPRADVRGEEGRAPVHDVGEELRTVHPPLVLDADAAGVDVPVARVPGDVLLPYALGDMAVTGPHHVVGRDLLGGIAENTDRRGEQLLGDMDDDAVDTALGGVRGDGVVRRVGGRPECRRVVRGARHGGTARADAGTSAAAAVTTAPWRSLLRCIALLQGPGSLHGGRVSTRRGRRSRLSLMTSERGLRFRTTVSPHVSPHQPQVSAEAPASTPASALAGSSSAGPAGTQRPRSFRYGHHRPSRSYRSWASAPATVQRAPAARNRGRSPSSQAAASRARARARESASGDHSSSSTASAATPPYRHARTADSSSARDRPAPRPAAPRSTAPAGRRRPAAPRPAPASAPPEPAAVRAPEPAPPAASAGPVRHCRRQAPPAPPGRDRAAGSPPCPATAAAPAPRAPQGRGAAAGWSPRRTPPRPAPRTPPAPRPPAPRRPPHRAPHARRCGPGVRPAVGAPHAPASAAGRTGPRPAAAPPGSTGRPSAGSGPRSRRCTPVPDHRSRAAAPPRHPPRPPPDAAASPGPAAPRCARPGPPPCPGTGPTPPRPAPGGVRRSGGPCRPGPVRQR